MQRRYQILCFVLLFVFSIIYDFNKPMTNDAKRDSCYVVLEGAFLKSGKYEFVQGMTIKELIDEVGVDAKANLNALRMDMELEDESTIYLPIKQKLMISLNDASKEELMKLPRVGEKTALKIIDYRNQKTFERIEELMNVSGIGEKTFLRLRDYLCL